MEEYSLAQEWIGFVVKRWVRVYFFGFPGFGEIELGNGRCGAVWVYRWGGVDGKI